MKWYTMAFNGALLARGFWLYIWDIRGQGKRIFYVGRTGDSSSANASSPFRRIGQHLDDRPRARANAMARNLRTVGIDPLRCSFRMIGIGPIFEEQRDFGRHKVFRDRAASLEHRVAEHLRSRNLTVIGRHSKPKNQSTRGIQEIIEVVDAQIK